MSATDAPPVNLLDPEWWADLDRVHEFFTWAREHEPVYRDANGVWVVTRHAAVIDVERRSRVFSSRGAYRVNIAMEESNTIALDDPEHLEQRRLVSRRFTPRAVQEEADFLTSRIDELLDAVAPQGQLEVVHDLAAQLPSRLTADLLGFPEDRWEDVKSWSERLMRTDVITYDNDALMGMMNAIMEFSALLTDTAAERKACPAHDLVSVWAGAEMDPLTMMHETGLFIAGGAETTRTAIARGLAVLAEHPDQWEAAAADPSLLHGLVEEVIRWVTPLNNMFRQVHSDDRIGAQPVASRRPGHARLPVRQPRRGGVRRPVPLRHPPRPQPARGLRAGHPLLRRRQPRPPRAAPAVRRADAAVDEPARGHAARHRAQRLRRRRAALRPGLRPALTGRG